MAEEYSSEAQQAWALLLTRWEAVLTLLKKRLFEKNFPAIFGSR